MAETHRIAVYGKGGVGKSMIATALSAHYALSGNRVLHVGCDPKCDSALRLLNEGTPLVTVLDVIGDDPEQGATETILNKGRLGIDCCESGGPTPGLGCGGRAVSRTIEYMDDMEILASGAYDVVIFDVLGDVVCGGFAAPLRLGFANKVLIVVSEEPMSMFAANNISRAIQTYHRNGVALAGLVANLRSNAADRSTLEAFAAELHTEILVYIERDERIMDAEWLQRTIVEHAPEAPVSAAIRALGDRLLAATPDTLPMPSPMSEQRFFEFNRAHRG